MQTRLATRLDQDWVPLIVWHSPHVPPLVYTLSYTELLDTRGWVREPCTAKIPILQKLHNLAMDAPHVYALLMCQPDDTDSATHAVLFLHGAHDCALPGLQTLYNLLSESPSGLGTHASEPVHVAQHMPMSDFLHDEPLVLQAALDSRGWAPIFPLHPYQLHSLGWMMHIERNIGTGSSCVRAPLWHRVSPHIVYDHHTKLFFPLEPEAAQPESEFRYRGALLCNETGSGKTAIALALVTMGACTPTTRDSSHKSARSWMMPRSQATLVIAPANLAQQWESEIHKFVGDTLCVMCVYSERHTRLANLDRLLCADIVITTRPFLDSTSARARMTEFIGAGTLQHGARDALRVSAHVHLRSARQNSDSQVPMPPLSEIWWERIIVDEVHEMFACASFSRYIQDYGANTWWGLTGTPGENLSTYLPLLVEDNPAMPLPLYAAYVRSCFFHTRGCPLQDPHFVTRYVDMSAAEQLLLQAHDSLESSVKACTYHGLSDTFVKSSRSAPDMPLLVTCDQVIDNVLASRASHLAASERTLATLQASRDEYGTIAATSRVRTVRADAQNKHNELVRRTAAHEAQHTHTQAQYNFFVKAVKAMRSTDAGHTQCPVCMDDDVTANTLLPCGHQFCGPCAVAWVSAHRTCPLCKAPTERGHLVCMAITQCGAYGSKMDAVTSHIKHAVAQQQRVLVFTQWTRLLHALKAMLKREGLPVACLAGNTVHRTSALNGFKCGKYQVLILSLDSSACGVNLCEADQVIFMHALVGPRTASLDMAVQAVRRAQRVGRRGTLNVTWFVAAHTPEQEAHDDFLPLLTAALCQ